MNTKTHLITSTTTLAVLSALTLAGLAGMGPFASGWVIAFCAFAVWGVLEVAVADVLSGSNDSFVHERSAETYTLSVPSREENAA